MKTGTIQQEMITNPAPGSKPATSGRAARRPGLHRGVLAVGAAALAVLGTSACAVSGPQASHSLNVCKLLPRSEVSSVTGASVVHAASAKLSAFPAPATHMCTYDLRDGQSIQVMLMPHLDKLYRGLGYAASSRGIEGGATPAAPVVRVTGVGDKAIASAAGLLALAGHDMILINGVPGEFAGHHAQDITLARTLIAALS
jgi:hypothetical protein